MPQFAQRSTELEIIDGAGLDFEQYRQAFEGIRRVNRYLGGTSSVTKHLFELMRPVSGRAVTILDVGTGTADIPIEIARWSRKKRVQVRVTAVDSEPFALQLARQWVAPYPEIELLEGNALSLPFADESFDFVIASLFLHHFDADQATELLRRFDRISRAAFIVNDLRRATVPYYFIKWMGKLFSRSSYFRNDAPLSVLRGFRDRDFEDFKSSLGQDGVEIFRHFPYRLVLVKTK